jgi:hypothetical protein
MVLTLVSSGVRLDIWVSRGWSFVLFAVVFWAIQWGWRFDRQIAPADGARSVVEAEA